MPLNRQQLIDLAVTEYFLGCNKHDFEQVIATFADNCVMWFPAAGFEYNGIQPLRDHFEDFLSTFKEINFHNFTNVVDIEAQLITSYFDIHLTIKGQPTTKMKNCNIFHIDQQGKFKEILIYNSGALSEGFAAGNSN